jgi:nucleoside-diphosphate-sugar epimerase
MSEILVSGSGGFVGKNLKQYLNREGFQVIPLSRTEPVNNMGISWSDLEPIKTSSIQAIIHLAGKAHDLKNTSVAQEYFDVNTGLTKKLFDAFLISNIPDFIYFSSVKAVADTVDGILTENVHPNPQTPYGQSKLQAEQYINSCKLPAGKRVFIFRPCMIHGPENKGNLNLLYKFVQKGFPYPLAAYQNTRSFLSIDNLNYIVGEVLKRKDISGGVYNLSDDKSLSTNQLIELIAEVSNKKPKLWKLNKSLINGLARAGDILHLPLNSERLKKLTESYEVSNEKIKNVLNIPGLPLSSSAGLEITIKSFLI